MGRGPGQPCHHPLAQQDGRMLVPCRPLSRPPSVPDATAVAPKTRTEAELKWQEKSRSRFKAFHF